MSENKAHSPPQPGGKSPAAETPSPRYVSVFFVPANDCASSSAAISTAEPSWQASAADSEGVALNQRPCVIERRRSQVLRNAVFDRRAARPMRSKVVRRNERSAPSGEISVNSIHWAVRVRNCSRTADLADRLSECPVHFGEYSCRRILGGHRVDDVAAQVEKSGARRQASTESRCERPRAPSNDLPTSS